MDVTRHNFPTELEGIRRAITESSFVAVDGEFSGLHAPDGERSTWIDTPSERYRQSAASVSQHLLLQFGLAAFRYDEDTDSYTHKTYNFYVFPRTSPNIKLPERWFASQASSLEFLSNQGFDFNKFIGEGVSYLRRDHFKACLEDLHRDHEQELRRKREAGAQQAMQGARVWKSRMPLVGAALGRHSSQSLSELVQLAARVDGSIKGFGDGDPWDHLEQLTFGLAQSG